MEMDLKEVKAKQVSDMDEHILIAEIVGIVLHDVEMRLSDEDPEPGEKNAHYCCVKDLSETIKNIRNKVDEILKFRNS